MIQELLGAREDESWGELRARMGRFLSLDTPVPSPVMKRIVEDPQFASDVVVARNAPAFLRALFADPKNADFAGAVPEDRSNTSLAREAAQAFLRWAKSGFTTADEATYRRRLDACASCEHHVDPPRKLVYRFANAETQKICDACGCTVARKARLASEHCPLADPLRPGFDRWGEPRAV